MQGRGELTVQSNWSAGGEETEVVNGGWTSERKYEAIRSP